MKTLFLILTLLLLGSASSLAKATLVAEEDSTYLITIDGIINEALKIISGDKGVARDLDKLRTLFVPTARFTSIFYYEDGRKRIVIFSLDDFIKMAGTGYEKYGFLEYELGKVIDEYNGIAQVFQSYYAKQGDYEEKGINSYQLVFMDDRWWITSIIWANNGNGAEIPAKFMEKH
ncbi:MAG: hypothetical protein IIA45_08975 [Bacteroidetes bacterium]|nr:hypothetical protein [Bacteroidota bacterium]